MVGTRENCDRKAMRLLPAVACAISCATRAVGFTGSTASSPHLQVSHRKTIQQSTCTARGGLAARSRFRTTRRLQGMELQMAAAAIVGAGRIGSALYDMGGGKDTLIGRNDDIPDGDGPIYVCTRNDDLADVIKRTPENRRQDLVFLQNGVLGPMLENQGLAKNTQALIYFAVSKKGAAPIDGITDKNPEGLTCACGKWADEFKERLAAGGLTCHVLPESRYEGRMYEKHIWICAFMLSGAVHKCNMGEVDSNHSDEVRALIGEMQAAIEAEYGATFEDGVPERLCAYARSVAHYPAALKEFQWRNGFFWEISEKAKREGKEDPCPLHSKLLREVAGDQGLTL